MFRKWLLGCAALLGPSAGLGAYQPGYPSPSPVRPGPVSSPIDGPWFFRGDPSRPCLVETVITRRGPQLVFTNEKGSRAFAQLSPDGQEVVIPDWNLMGRIQGNRLVWPNGDFWAR